MRIFPILFWATAAATVLWCGAAAVRWSVAEFYHPMAALGDHMHVARILSFAIPVVVSIAMLALWVRRRPLSQRTYLFGIVPLCVAAVLPILPRIDSDYEQVYWLGEQRHSIPWRYAPFNGQSQTGGSSFLVRVRGQELAPYYTSRGERYTLGKAVGSGRGGVAPFDNCEVTDYNSICEWKSGNYVYSLSSNDVSLPSDPEKLFRRIEELLDSFESDLN